MLLDITLNRILLKIKGTWTLLLNAGQLNSAVTDLLLFLRISEVQQAFLDIFDGLSQDQLLLDLEIIRSDFEFYTVLIKFSIGFY